MDRVLEGMSRHGWPDLRLRDRTLGALLHSERNHHTTMTCRQSSGTAEN
jgi:hypothetical protein